MGDQRKGYFEQSRDLTNSLILIAPLLVLYEAGLLAFQFAGLNGVDFLTVLVVRNTGLRGLVVFNLLLLVGIAATAHARKKDKRFDPGIAPLVVGEASAYAVLLGFVIVSIMKHLPFDPAAQAGPRELGIVQRVIASLGAGVNEELVFRLGLYNICALGLAGGKEPNSPAPALGAVLVSSVLFSLAHYLGSEPFQLYSFVYRVLAGAIFCGLYLGRGLAVAVYTHAIYDIIVLCFRA